MQIISFCAALHCHLWRVWLYRILPYYLKHLIFGGKSYWTYNVCVLIFSTMFEAFLILITWWDDDINVHRSSCKVRVILVKIDKTCIFLADFWEILKYQIAWKSIPWEPSCCVQTDMLKLTVAFSILWMYLKIHLQSKRRVCLSIFLMLLETMPFHSSTFVSLHGKLENSDASTECTFMNTWRVGIWSVKMVLIPGINTVYKWTCLKIFFNIYSEVHFLEIYTGME